MRRADTLTIRIATKVNRKHPYALGSSSHAFTATCRLPGFGRFEVTRFDPDLRRGRRLAQQALLHSLVSALQRAVTK